MPGGAKAGGQAHRMLIPRRACPLGQDGGDRGVRGDGLSPQNDDVLFFEQSPSWRNAASRPGVAAGTDAQGLLTGDQAAGLVDAVKPPPIGIRV